MYETVEFDKCGLPDDLLYLICETRMHIRSLDNNLRELSMRFSSQKEALIAVTAERDALKKELEAR